MSSAASHPAGVTCASRSIRSSRRLPPVVPIFLIAVGTALAAGPVGSLALFVAYSLGRGLVLTAVAP